MKKTTAILTVILVLLTSTAFGLPKMKFNRNNAGDQTFAVPRGYINSYLLTASTAKTITIPTGARYAVFAATSDIWVRIGTGTAAIPAGDTVDGTGSELNPVCRWVENETQMSVISAFAAKISIAYYE